MHILHKLSALTNPLLMVTCKVELTTLTKKRNYLSIKASSVLQKQ